MIFKGDGQQSLGSEHPFIHGLIKDAVVLKGWNPEDHLLKLFIADPDPHIICGLTYKGLLNKTAYDLLLDVKFFKKPLWYPPLKHLLIVFNGFAIGPAIGLNGYLFTVYTCHGLCPMRPEIADPPKHKYKRYCTEDKFQKP